MSVPPPLFPYPPSVPAQVQARLNPLAVTALVTSLLCLAPLGLIFGAVALLQISRNGQRGKGLAIAGISVSGAVLLLVGLAAPLIDFKVWTLPARSDSGEAAGPGWTTVHSLTAGDCFDPGSGLPERDTLALGARACDWSRATSHTEERCMAPSHCPGRENSRVGTGSRRSHDRGA